MFRLTCCASLAQKRCRISWNDQRPALLFEIPDTAACPAVRIFRVEVDEVGEGCSLFGIAASNADGPDPRKSNIQS